eukprot:1154520-Pelagomonas_calceolata.AAC.2
MPAGPKGGKSVRCDRACGPWGRISHWTVCNSADEMTSLSPVMRIAMLKEACKPSWGASAALLSSLVGQTRPRPRGNRV